MTVTRIIARLMFLATFFITSAHALPIDWHGFFGVDTNLIDNYRRIEQTDERTTGTSGSQEVSLAPGKHANASWQSYLVRLNPVLIVNDAASIKGEITSGYPRGGRFGDSSQRNLEGGFGNALYMYNTYDATNELVLNKFFMELYSDTGTYKIGRHSYDWGLGAIYDSGDDAWDRHTFTRDGVTLFIQLDNFHITPYWAKISSENSLTRATAVKEYGISLLYDNLERDLAFGILYGKKQNGAFNLSVTSNVQDHTSNMALGKTDVEIIDLYFRKAFGELEFQIEAPIMTGEIGYLYESESMANYKARGIILESSYELDHSWKFGVDAGRVSGDSGSTSSFEALYLNPNYQIANLLFRYNLRAVANPDQVNIYDSYISNANYYKLWGQFSRDKWSFYSAFIYATADETASAGSTAFNSQANTHFDAQTTQADDLGFELDAGFKYHWNADVTISGDAGYLFTGDYFAYTNDPNTTNTATNSFILQLAAGITF